MSNNIFVRLLPFPFSIRAAVLPNNDGTFDIYINSNLPEELQHAALEHELKHINKDHFYDCNPVWLNEQEAG